MEAVEKKKEMKTNRSRGKRKMHQKRSHERKERDFCSIHTTNIKSGMGLSPLVLQSTVPAVAVR
jgi:hypothetical protein